MLVFVEDSAGNRCSSAARNAQSLAPNCTRRAESTFQYRDLMPQDDDLHILVPTPIGTMTATLTRPDEVLGKDKVMRCQSPPRDRWRWTSSR